MGYTKYLEICRRAVEGDMFDTFKSHDDYRQILEHLGYNDSLVHLTAIERDNPDLITMLSVFADNDIIGSTQTCSYPSLGMDISPSTIRYTKVLSDLILHFGYLDGMDIVEIGGGYGGQCLIVDKAFAFNSYTIIDLKEPSALQRKYLDYHGVENVRCVTPDMLEFDNIDLCISNYAFSEIGRTFQDAYIEKVIKPAKNGYITCNVFGNDNINTPLTREDVVALKPNHLVLKEEPHMVEDNFIYIWHE